MQVANAHGLRVWEAELYRLRGELLWQHAADAGGLETMVIHTSSAAVGTVESCFRRTLDIACQQQAKSLELRAAVSLSRLWLRQGKHYEAHELLAGIYAWLTEGLDTLDLREARLLLAAV